MGSIPVFRIITNPAEEGRRHLAESLERMRIAHEAGENAARVIRMRSDDVDALVSALFTHFAEKAPENSGVSGRMALIATGGYGRRELSPFSDADLSFIVEEGTDAGEIRKFVEGILYVMWDLPLELGHSVRSISDAVEVAGKDSKVRNSLLDARLVCGSQGLFRKFQSEIMNQIFHKNTSRFVEDKIAERVGRYAKYGSSVYMLEPNVKDGEGGLRDIHVIGWVGKVKYRCAGVEELLKVGAISNLESRKLIESFVFITRIRNQLHFQAGKKTDQMTFDLQEKMARFFKYQDTKWEIAVERFMMAYYRHASAVRGITGEFLGRASEDHQRSHEVVGQLVQKQLERGFKVSRGYLIATTPEMFGKEPASIIRAFELAQRANVELGAVTKDALAAGLKKAGRLSGNGGAESFLAIFRNGSRIFDTLNLMHEMGVLERVIPEFRRIRHRVQHDIYHVYTVDVHSLFAVREIERLANGEYDKSFNMLGQICRDLKNIRILYLAALLHDTGKGKGHGHAEKGAISAGKTCQSLGLAPEETADVVFLVRNHLDLANIAQRRDLNDQKVISDFAELCGSQERLSMLYLLTFADLRAVGPDVWTDWKASLVQELHIKTMDFLEKGGQGERYKDLVEKAREKLRALEIPGVTCEEMEGKLGLFEDRYYLNNEPDEIAGHISMLKSLAPGRVITLKKDRTKRGFSEVSVVAYDSIGLLAKITGVLSANSVNILSAQINTQKDGTIVDVFRVTRLGGPLSDQEKWLKISRDLEAVIEGRLAVEKLLEKKSRPSIIKPKIARIFPPKVKIDVESSERFTIVDVFAHDRIGLLYDITRTFAELGVRIQLSKISTHVDQVADVFYISDGRGEKIVDRNALSEIASRLLKVAGAGG